MTTHIRSTAPGGIYLATKMHQPTLLVDGDPIVYKAAACAEEELDFDPELTVITGDFKTGRRVVTQAINDLLTRFDTSELVLYFTSPTNFRKEVCETYKGNRTKRKPCGYKKLKNWAMATWPSEQIEGLEADDALGIAATSGKFERFVLCSPDKDLEQFACRIWNGKEEFTQTTEAAELKRWMQSLTGDSTDGYKGVPQCGPKKAEAILKKVKDGKYYEAVLKTYIEAGLTEADALSNIRLATILSTDDWDAEKQKPILFTP